VISEDINDLAASYDEVAAADKTAEFEAVTRMLRSGQHAARQHRERTAALVRELFAQTPRDNAVLRDVKLILGSRTGSPSWIRRSIRPLSPCTPVTANSLTRRCAGIVRD
jgi:hypothetical protein